MLVVGGGALIGLRSPQHRSPSSWLGGLEVVFDDVGFISEEHNRHKSISASSEPQKSLESVCERKHEEQTKYAQYPQGIRRTSKPNGELQQRQTIEPKRSTSSASVPLMQRCSNDIQRS